MISPAPAASATSTPAGTWRGTAFGISLETPFPLPWLLPASENGAGARQSSVQVVSLREFTRLWATAEPTRVLRRTYPDGSPMLTIDRDESLGYCVEWPGHGRHLVARDGRRIVSVLPELPPWRWQKFLFAVVLPLAARLHGLEVFHASAVAVERRVFAFTAPSGVGKSSLAAHLAARGAELVSDDVIAVELGANGAGPLVFPSPSMASIADRELAAMTAEGRGRLGSVIGRSDKVVLAANVVERPLPLAGLYFLRRSGSGLDLAISEIEPPDPRLLLGATFVSYIREPEQLVRQLDACARIAASLRTFEVRIPRSFAAREVAELVEAHITSAPARTRT